MPQKPRRPCRYPGCPGFCEQGQVFCKDHMEWSGDRLRGGADARGYDSRWRKARALFLKQHPLCAFCQAEGKVVPATVVDHIIPHRAISDCSGIKPTGSRSARDAMTRKRAPAYKIGGQHEESIFRSLPCAGQAPG